MHDPWTKEELSAIWKEVMVESDRGCIMLCAAHLDRGLEKLLRLKFHSLANVSDSEIDKVLTDYPVAALLGFATRARVAHLLGVIPKDLSIALRKFATIRNEYAHNDNVPPLTEQTMQPILDARENRYQELTKGAVTAFYDLQKVVETYEHSKGRMTLMIATLQLGWELRTARERVAKEDGPVSISLPPLPDLG